MQTTSDTSLSKSASPLVGRALDIDARFGHLVQYAGAAVVPAKPALLTLSDERVWLVLDARTDPQVVDGNLAMPRRVQRHLQQIEQAAIGFDMLFIAHELPAHAVKGIRPADLDKPEIVKELVGRPSENMTARKVAHIANRTIDVLAKTTIVAGKSLAAVGGAALGALDSLALDPAIFGVVTATDSPRQGELGAWFLIAHWT